MHRQSAYKTSHMLRIYFPVAVLYLWVMCLAVAFHFHGSAPRNASDLWTINSSARTASQISTFTHARNLSAECIFCQWVSQGVVSHGIIHTYIYNVEHILGYLHPSALTYIEKAPQSITSRGPPSY